MLMKSGAFPGSARGHRIAAAEQTPEALLMLQGHSLATQTIIGDGSDGCREWRFTCDGLLRLVQVWKLDGTSYALERRTDVTLEQCSVYELMAKLQHDGWVWAEYKSPAQRKKKGVALPPLAYIPEQPKIWLSTHALPFRSYLLCLLQARRLCQGAVNRILHGQSDKSYKSVLNGKPWPDAAAEPDFDAARQPRRGQVPRQARRGAGSGPGRGGVRRGAAAVKVESGEAQGEAAQEEGDGGERGGAHCSLGKR